MIDQAIDLIMSGDIVDYVYAKDVRSFRKRL